MKKIRRTLLYIPGNQPALINGAGIYGADVIVFDLEDSISVDEKDSARILVKNALKFRNSLFPENTEIMIRINHISTPFFEKDLELIKNAPDSIRIPKVESGEEIKKIHDLIAEKRSKYNIEKKIETVAIIETLKGLNNIEEIVKSGIPILTGLTLGAEDFTRDLGTSRSISGDELMFARQKLVFIAKLYGIDAIDTVFSNVLDIENLKKETEFIKGLGFTGKSAIHPSQIDIINDVFSPSEEEIKNSIEILVAAKQAENQGLGVVSLYGKMIDTPVIKKAQMIVNTAQNLGLEVKI